MPLPALIGGAMLLGRGALTAATFAPLLKPAVGIAKRFLQRGARPGIGSKVTKGPLKLGKQTLYGPARPGTGAVLRSAGAAAVGIGAIASHRTAKKPAPQTAPAPRRSNPPASKQQTGERKCCPAGTRRMVCYKRGRVKPRLGSKASKWRRKPKRTKAAKRTKRTRRTRRK